MFLVIVLILFAASVWCLTALFRRLYHRKAGLRTLLWSGGLALSGSVLGYWAGFCCEYPIGSKWRIGSFPIPIVIFHREHGNWVDYVVPAFQAWMSTITNTLIILSVFTSPLWWITRRMNQDGCQVP